MILSCQVIPREYAIISAERLEQTPDTCYAEILLKNGAPALFCRGEHYGLIGYITERENGKKEANKKIKVVGIKRNQQQIPIEVLLAAE